jgi:hypothetical protein
MKSVFIPFAFQDSIVTETTINRNVGTYEKEILIKPNSLQF